MNWWRRFVCWWHGHEFETDWSAYPDAPYNLIDRLRWQFEIQLFYGHLKQRCARCGRKEPP